MGRFDEVHARSLKDPNAFRGEAAEKVSLAPEVGPGPRRPQRSLLPLVHRRRGQHLLQRARPARRGRARRADGADLRQPGHRDRPSFTYRELRDQTAPAPARSPPGRRQGRPGHHLHADGARGRRGDARLRAARRGALGGVRRFRRQRTGHADQRRRAEGDHLASCGIEGKKVIEYKPLLDEAIQMARHKPTCIILQRPMAKAR